MGRKIAKDLCTKGRGWKDRVSKPEKGNVTNVHRGMVSSPREWPTMLNAAARSSRIKTRGPTPSAAPNSRYNLGKASQRERSINRILKDK